MAEDDTDSIRAVLKVYIRFDGEDTTHVCKYKSKLGVVLQFHRQSIVAILQCEPKPTAAQNSTAVAA